MRTLDLDALHIFRTVAEQGGITRAAAKRSSAHAASDSMHAIASVVTATIASPERIAPWGLARRTSALSAPAR